MQGKANVPAIRFAGFMNAWKLRKLGEISSLITKGTTPLDKTGNGKVNFIKIENIDSSSGEIIPEMKISVEEHNGYLKRSQLKENDILFSIAGTLGRVSVVKSNVLPANTNQALAIIRTKEGDLNYLATVLKGRAVSDFVKKNPTVGAQPNLSLEQVGNLEIPYPSLDEQQVIGKYFSTLDHLITLYQRKYSRLCNIKKSMLEKMFPKEGETTPEIRFAGFTNTWEQRKLGDVAKYRNGKAHENDIVEQGKYLVVNSKFVSTDGAVRKYSNKQIEPLFKNEIAFVLSDVPNGKAIARTYLVDKDDKYTLNQRIAGITPTENICPYYLYILLNRNRYFLQFDDGVKQTNLSITDVMEFEEYYPSKEEQYKIGAYFQHLDHLIILHQRKLERLQNIKKSFLEKMFV